MNKIDPFERAFTFGLSSKLDKLAEVAVKVGLRLERGQELVITSPIAALPLVRLITKHAYIAGAAPVSYTHLTLPTNREV